MGHAPKKDAGRRLNGPIERLFTSTTVGVTRVLPQKVPECGVTSAVCQDDHEYKPRTQEQHDPFLGLTIALVPEPSISHF